MKSGSEGEANRKVTPKKQTQTVNIGKQTHLNVQLSLAIETVASTSSWHFAIYTYIFSFESLVNEHIITSEQKAAYLIYGYVKSPNELKGIKVK